MAAETEDPGSLRQVAAEILARLERGEAIDSSEYSARFPEHRGAIEEILAVERLLRTAAADAEPASEPSRQLDDAPLAGDFRIVRKLGEGGMGAVYEAEQLSLGRRVALKVLERTALTSRDAIERFRREASTAAKLSHPNIVPVYSFGEAGGISFIAMELVDGRTLEEIIRRLRSLGRSHIGETEFLEVLGARAPAHDGDSVRRPAEASTGGRRDASIRSSTRSRSHVHAASQLIAAVAEGLEHAHAAGVIHRDLKPANVMVRPDGTPMIMDFGIARGEGSETLTRTGQFLGTVPYMSREQLSPTRGALDRRADVYSLGVTLYELLTLRRPYDGDTSERIIAQIQTQEPVAPRRVNPRLSEDAETIVLKAIDHDRDRRYATAGELAADLRRFCNREPILARPAGPLLKVGRWAQRNPALASSVAALFLLLAGALTVTIVLLREARADRILAESRGREATESLRQAMLAVQKMLTEVGDSELAEIPQMEPVRRRLLEAALEFNERFLRARADDAVLLRETGLARVRMSSILFFLGRFPEAEEHARRGIALLERLEGEPAREARLDVAEAYYRLGSVIAQTGRRDEAETILEKAVAAAEGASPNDPPSAEARHQLAEALTTLGVVKFQAGHYLDAEKAWSRGVEVEKSLIALLPDARDAKRRLAAIQRHLGSLLCQTGRTGAGMALLGETVSLLESLEASDPGRVQIQSDLASCQRALATHSRATGDSVEAEERFRAAAAVYERLIAQFPSVSRFHEGLARCLAGRASILSGTARGEEARELLHRSLDLAEKLHAGAPESVDFEVLLVDVETELAFLLASAGEMDDARARFTRSIALGEKIVAVRRGAYSLRALARLRVGLAWILNRTGEIDEAVAEYRKAAALREAILTDFPGWPDDTIALGSILSNLAVCLWPRHDWAELRQLLQESVRLIESVVEAAPRDSGSRATLRISVTNLANVHLELGEMEEAAARAEQIWALLPDSFDGYVLAAGILARCAPPREPGDQAGAGALPEARGRRAVELLEKAGRLGYADARRLSTEPSFEAIRERPDFASLLKTIEENAAAAAK